jgi:hypothetical protein
MRTLCSKVGSYKLLVWALCAAISLSSSKHLLVDVGLHYPLHLHLLQLSAVTLWSIARFVARGPRELLPPAVDARSAFLLGLVLPCCILIVSLQYRERRYSVELL